MKRHWFWMIAAAFAALLLCGISLAEVTPDLSFFPREAIAVGDSLDFDFSDIDRTMDHYVHVLREEADGTYRLRVVAFRDGYIRRGDRTIILTVGETDETMQGTIPEP